jgi:hypothetical protein
VTSSSRASPARRLLVLLAARAPGVAVPGDEGELRAKVGGGAAGRLSRSTPEMGLGRIVALYDHSSNP